MLHARRALAGAGQQPPRVARPHSELAPPRDRPGRRARPRPRGSAPGRRRPASRSARASPAARSASRASRRRGRGGTRTACSRRGLRRDRARPAPAVARAGRRSAPCSARSAGRANSWKVTIAETGLPGSPNDQRLAARRRTRSACPACSARPRSAPRPRARRGRASRGRAGPTDTPPDTHDHVGLAERPRRARRACRRASSGTVSRRTSRARPRARPGPRARRRSSCRSARRRAARPARPARRRSRAAPTRGRARAAHRGARPSEASTPSSAGPSFVPARSTSVAARARPRRRGGCWPPARSRARARARRAPRRARRAPRRRRPRGWRRRSRCGSPCPARPRSPPGARRATRRRRAARRRRPAASAKPSIAEESNGGTSSALRRPPPAPARARPRAHLLGRQRLNGGEDELARLGDREQVGHRPQFSPFRSPCLLKRLTRTATRPATACSCRSRWPCAGRSATSTRGQAGRRRVRRAGPASGLQGRRRARGAAGGGRPRRGGPSGRAADHHLDRRRLLTGARRGVGEAHRDRRPGDVQRQGRGSRLPWAIRTPPTLRKRRRARGI